MMAAAAAAAAVVVVVGEEYRLKVEAISIKRSQICLKMLSANEYKS
jgi:hypothetical protein